MAIIWAESLSKWEQDAAEAFKAQAHRECEHIWEKVDPEVFQCEVCADFMYQREWWRNEF